MQLYSRIVGNGPPLIILHGLFGMSDNWLTVGRELARHGLTVHIPDLRNHGRSPHTETHRYPEMSDDLLDYFGQQDLQRATIIGHSMGGKVAMIFALLHPEKVEKLVVVDIAPVDYRLPGNSFHRNLIDTLLEIDLNKFHERGAIRLELERRLHDLQLAAFLAKNIARQQLAGKFRWKCNLEVLQKYLQHLHIGLDELEIHAPCPVPTLFVKGNESDYYLPQHDTERLFFFPDSEVTGIDNAGHWVHSEQSERFLGAVLAFIETEPQHGH